MVGLGRKLGTQAMDSEWPNPQHIFGGPTQPYNRQFYWKKMVKNYTIHITLLKYEIFALWKVPKLMKHHNFKGSEGSPNLRTEPRTSRTLGLSSKTEPRTYRTPQNGRTSNQVRSKSTWNYQNAILVSRENFWKVLGLFYHRFENTLSKSTVFKKSF